MLLGALLKYKNLLHSPAYKYYDASQYYRFQLHSDQVVDKNIVNKSTIVFVGDVMLGRSVQTQALNNNDFSYPFLKVREFLSSSDIVFANLENPIISNCPIHNAGFVFCAKSDFAKAIQKSGIDIVNLANNHTMNYGIKGLGQTKNILSENGVKYTGVGDVAVVSSNGIKFGFLGFDKSQIAHPALTQREKELISRANFQVDVLIVSMHWGIEYQDYANSGQRNLAKEMVDLGADFIVGHHPHVVQDYEEILGVPVFYSLGNFIFDQMWSEKTKRGKLLKVFFENTQIVKIEEYDTYIDKIGQPIILNS